MVLSVSPVYNKPIIGRRPGYIAGFLASARRSRARGVAVGSAVAPAVSRQLPWKRKRPNGNAAAGARDPRCGPAGRLGRTSTLRPLDSPLLWRLGHPRVAAGGWRPLTGPRADHGRPRSSIPDPASRAPVETGDALCAAPRRAAAAGVVVGSPRSHAPTAMPSTAVHAARRSQAHSSRRRSPSREPAAAAFA